MKHSKLFVAGAAALALSGCYSMPSSSEGSAGPVGYNGASTTGGMTVDTGATGYTGPTGSAEIKGEAGTGGDTGTAGRMKGSADSTPGKTRPEYLDIIYSPLG
ncbi:MAG TPA: collagen-like protein [Burkholderiales bacterium]